jgi:hypothetical protein
MAIAGILMLGGLASGCGQTGHTSQSASAQTAPATSITRTDFLARANAICGSADPALAEAAAKLAARPSASQVAAVVKGTYVPMIKTQITQISALGAPSGDRTAVAAMLKMVQADLKKLQSRPALVTTDVFADFARVAHPYGLTACAPTS